jgi:hypothetical protein
MQWNKRLAWAWAAAGLFAVTSMLGACDSLVSMGPTVEGVEPKPPRVTLTQAPKQYTIDVSRVSQGTGVGGCRHPTAPPRG